MKPQRIQAQTIGFWCALIMALCLSTSAHAKEQRFALLVGHEQGWKKDPPLRYALKGDLRPMAHTLRAFGFQVQTLENQSPKALRKALRQLAKRAKQAPRITTFLFYYSGHSDRHQLHMGPRKQGKPISYLELVDAFRKLSIARRYIILDSCFSGEIIRKFGSISRYKQLVSKGARAKRLVDLSQNFDTSSDERSLQVISSGLAVSWESQRYRASIFTHHLLRGLRGRADRDLNGMISASELFDFVSDAMMKDIQEKPKMFGVVHRSRSYALAPAYNSHLWIDAGLKGQLQVSVANFYWAMKKRQRRPMRLALIHGKGTVHLRKGNQCWKQPVVLPKGGEVRLSPTWTPMRCKRFARRPKGSISMDAQLAPPKPTMWRIEARAGILRSVLAPGLPLFGAEIGANLSFVGLYAGAWGSQSTYGNQTTETLLLFHTRLEAGYRHKWECFSLFTGAFAEGQLLTQMSSLGTNAGLVFHYGGALTGTFWLQPRWGLTLNGRVGATLGQLGPKLVHAFTWSAMLGLTYHI